MPHRTFITNSDTKTLKKRLEQLIEHSQELKFLVGFFYFSGWQQLYQTLKSWENLQIKVLVGLDVDQKLGQVLEFAHQENQVSREEKADRFFASLTHALNNEQMDIEEFYEQVDFFLRLLEENRLILKKTADPNHAKLYLFKMKDTLKGLSDCRFITGSSNLTRAGILEQNEFNVEISDYGTTEAEQYFDALWESAVEISGIPDRKKYLIDIIRNHSQAAIISPFEAYCLVLKTYIDLMEQKAIKPQIIRLLEKCGYIKYSYQLDAINQAITIIEHYNGVIIADVVGLGKSIIASLVGKHLSRRGMILCPPGLIGDKEAKSGWKKYKQDFELYDWEIWSSGDLEGASNYLKLHGEDIEVVIVDEAHRFRNQDTANYEFLSNICRERIVILLTATPFNNSPADIFSLLKLFIVPGKSTITLDNDLESRFIIYESTFKRLSYISKNYNSSDPDKKAKAENYYNSLFGELPVDLSKVHIRATYLASEIRKVLEPVLIRRNRLDLKNDPLYSQEINELSEMEANPRELFFELTREQSTFYDEIINDYFGETGQFTGAIYQPFSYEKRKTVEAGKLDIQGNRAYQQQRNLYDFMRRLVVKRFESSFGAFQQSIYNFIRVHERVLQFIENSGGRYILDRNLIEKIYESDPDEIESALEQFSARLLEKRAPKNDRIYLVSEFDLADQFIKDIKADLALMGEIKNRIIELHLAENDPKANRLVKEVKNILNEKQPGGEPVRKVVIFTEYIDTVKHVLPYLESHFKNGILYFEGVLTATKVNQLLFDFDASIDKADQEDKYQILLTSDKLSEGINLNRAGAIINYDIPWNPTRVIQRVGRINRIGKKVFDRLRIYNFFPTETGADIIKSRMIAGQKMFLIHNTLGEDAKIFDVDETPSASELYKRINRNPEEGEAENLLTTIRKEFSGIKEKYPAVIDRISNLPSRVKTAKASYSDQLFVYRRKGLGFFVHSIENPGEEKTEVCEKSFGDTLTNLRCSDQEPRLLIGKNFWKAYEEIKEFREVFRPGKNELSLEVKAQNNLQSALHTYKHELDPYLPFIRTLIKDIREYRTLSQYSIRRLASVNLTGENRKELDLFVKELKFLKGWLGEDYLDKLEDRIGSLDSEIIIAVEHFDRRIPIDIDYYSDHAIIDEIIHNFSQADDNQETLYFLPVKIYLFADLINEDIDRKFIKSVDQLFDTIGFENYIEFKAEYGSLKQWLIKKLNKPETKKEIYKRLQQFEQYIENETLRKSHIENGKASAEAIAALINSLPSDSDVLLDAGAFFVAQKTDEKGKRTIIGRLFTPEELKYLEEHPQLRNNPNELLKVLAKNQMPAFSLGKEIDHDS